MTVNTMNLLPYNFTDISIKFGHVPQLLDNVFAQGAIWQIASSRFLFNLPDIARYLVEYGKTVTIEPALGVDHRVIYSFFQMTPLAALIYQRGMIVFHAAALVRNNKAVLLAGAAGAGKSALLTELVGRGWTMLSDDLAIVSLDEQCHAIVHPTYPETALWPDTLVKLKMNFKVHPFCDANRKRILHPEKFETASQPLQAIFWLGVHGNNYCELKELKGSARFSAVGILQYNSHIADAICDRGKYLHYAANIAQTVPIIHLLRPNGKWSLTEMADIIEKKCMPRL